VVPSNRIAPVTAHSIATINQMAPGRVMLGIGTGFTGRNMMGLPPVPLAAMREHIQLCRGLLSGDEVLYREGKRERWIRFMQLDRGRDHGARGSLASQELPADDVVDWQAADADTC